jgi:hypothetical protein
VIDGQTNPIEKIAKKRLKSHFFERGMRNAERGNDAFSRENSNIQAPSSREIPNIKHQRSRAKLELGPWSFSGCWSLEVGIWSFSPGEAQQPNPQIGIARMISPSEAKYL